jgi:hypothetical protein
MSSDLILHVDAQALTSADLETIPSPEALGNRHYPVAHRTLVGALKTVAQAAGFSVVRERLGLNEKRTKLFGVIDLQEYGQEAEMVSRDGMALGFRNSTDQTLGVALVAGRTVFVCDNLALAGDLVLLKHKNTRNLDDNLYPMMEEAFSRIKAQNLEFQRLLEKAENTPLSKAQAEVLMWDAVVRRKIVPKRLALEVDENYFHPQEEWTDITSTPNTVAALHNAFTRVIRKMPLNQQWDKSHKLAKLLEVAYN